MMEEEKKNFTHIDAQNQPTMVDVSDKTPTLRQAEARSIIFLGEEIMALLKEGEIITKKGAVFQTAIIAGVMAAKKTADLIPFCHTLPLESCKIRIETEMESQSAIIHCVCKVFAKTGVEMEALIGANMAALTIYDMCKAISSQMLIKETRLVSKTGGKMDYLYDENQLQG